MSAPTTSTTAQAYAVCAAITRSQAGNFFWGIRLLPPDKREALCALYALSRRIDDIGDGDLPAPEKLEALAELRGQVLHLDISDDPVLQAVADTAERYPVPLGAFVEMVDGVEMDVLGRRYATFSELEGYCRRVAGTVGRLCLGVFGAKPDAQAPHYADSLGIALQQVNILRDIREDLANGRVYLPQDELDAYEVELKLDENGTLHDPDGHLAALVRASAYRARQWYAEGLRLMPLLDRRSAACCGAMAGIYLHLLDQIGNRPEAVFDRRLSLSGWTKAGVAARALSGRRP